MDKIENKNTNIVKDNKDNKNNNDKKVKVAKIIKHIDKESNDNKKTNVTNPKHQESQKNKVTKKVQTQNQTQKQTPNKKQDNKPENKKVTKTDKKEVKQVEKEDGFQLLDKFKKLEKELVDALKTIPSDVSEEGKNSEKENIKSYIDKVNKARKIFDEYEAIAQKLTDMTIENENDQETIEISKKVIESREENNLEKFNEPDLIKQYNNISKQTKGEEKVEIEAMGDKIIVKKKKISTSEKEL